MKRQRLTKPSLPNVGEKVTVNTDKGKETGEITQTFGRILVIDIDGRIVVRVFRNNGEIK
jgi:hypothetical protein